MWFVRNCGFGEGEVLLNDHVGSAVMVIVQRSC